jgi:hypothetical protein
MDVGMAPPSSSVYMARTQFYFIDACRTPRRQLEHCYRPSPTSVFTPVDTLHTTDDRGTAPIFHATLPGDVAVAQRGVGSIFSQALVECLSGDAGDLDDHLGWVVRPPRLREVLDLKMKALDEEQRPEVSGRWGDDPLCMLKKRPNTRIRFHVSPQAALPFTRIFTRKEGQAKERSLPMPLNPHPHDIRVPAGFYGIRAESDSNEWVLRNGQETVRKMLPPEVEKEIHVDRVKP